jgi:hypothetical protein
MTLGQEVDLLLDPVCIVFAVNCEIFNDTIKIGAIYLEPQCTEAQVHLSGGGATVVVDLPPEWLNRPNALVAWSVELPHHHEQVQRRAAVPG